MKNNLPLLIFMLVSYLSFAVLPAQAYNTIPFESSSENTYTDSFKNLKISKSSTKEDVDVFTYTFANWTGRLSLEIIVAKGDTVESGVYTVSNAGTIGTVASGSGSNTGNLDLLGSYITLDRGTFYNFFLKTGTLSITKSENSSTYNFDFVTNNGSILSNFILNNSDIPFKDEMNIPSILRLNDMTTVEKDEGQMIDDNSKLFSVLIQNEENHIAVKLLVVGDDNYSSLADGTYLVTDSKEINTVIKSTGDYTPSIVYSSSNSNIANYPLYISSGELIIETLNDTTKSFVFNGLAHFNSRLMFSSIMKFNKDELNAIQTSQLSKLEVYVENTTIVVQNKVNSPLDVYTIDGKCVYTTQTHENKTVISGLQQKSIYIVRSGDEVRKIYL